MRSALKAGVSAMALMIVAMMGPARAADLPVAEPVKYIRMCETYSTGFWYIPGTDTCLRIGGYVRFQIVGHSDNVSDDHWVGH
jgi:hypothetical protein